MQLLESEQLYITETLVDLIILTQKIEKRLPVILRLGELLAGISNPDEMIPPDTSLLRSSL